jgi:TRAP-type mannitol/chloroaromatic compound transport system permease large subunit
METIIAIAILVVVVVGIIIFGITGDREQERTEDIQPLLGVVAPKETKEKGKK